MQAAKMAAEGSLANAPRLTEGHASFYFFFSLVKEVAENQKETDSQMKENERISKERSAKLDKQIGSLTNLFGDFTLGIVAPKLREKFSDLKLVFLKSNLNVEVNDNKSGISLEIDIMLENGDKAMLVEVKTKLTKERIYKHIERLEKMRRYADIHGDKRTFLGAVAGFAITEEVRRIALEEGFYLIEPDGENFNITAPNDEPKEW
ncbi:MAG: hypothetical protein LBC80_09085 [Treponema sp.]|jgi:hypothetical protein|nr:hypothetical protein [Treponema sp.]